MSDTEKLKAQLVIITGLAVLGVFFKSLYFYYSAALLGIIFLSLPWFSDLILKGWFKLAELLGWINSRILLSLVFYIFLSPLAMLNRLFSKDLLKLKKSAGSMYSPRNHKFTKKDLENIW